MGQQNYWQRQGKPTTLNRRRLLGAGATTGLGLGAFALVGCGDDDDDATSSPTPSGGSTPGASATTSTAQPKQGGTAKLAQPRDIPHYDPHTETYPAGFMVSLVHAGLLKFKQADDPNALQPEAYLAESYEQPDATTFTVKLRPNATFHDAAPVNGRVITADDVKFSFERIKTDKPEFQRRTFFAAVQSITAIDATTVQFKLDKAFAPLPIYLADTWNVVVPKELVEAKGDMRDTAIGAGPFTLASYEKGVGLKMSRVEEFWFTGGPYIDEVQMPVMSDTAAILAAFRAKQLDIMRGLPWAEVPGLQKSSDVEVRDYTNVDNQYVRINTKKKPLDDPRVRQAMSMVIDRNVVANGAFQGNGIPCGVFPSAVKWAVKPEDLEFYKTDVKAAKELLSAAGYPDGFEIENLYPSGSGKQQDMVAVVIDQLRQINIKVTNKTLEYGAYLQAAFSKEFDINIHWGNRYDEIDGYAIEYLTTGGRNFGYWGSVELDKLILAQRETLDEAQRGKQLEDIQKKIGEEMYTIGIANWKDYDAWYKKLQNFGTSVHWFRPAQQLAQAWIEA